jgi:hypothetical protein
VAKCADCGTDQNLLIVCADVGFGAFLEVLCEVCWHRRQYRAHLQQLLDQLRN